MDKLGYFTKQQYYDANTALGALRNNPRQPIAMQDTSSYPGQHQGEMSWNPTLRDYAEIGLGFTPAGVAVDIHDMGKAIKDRDMIGMGLGAVGFIPGAGDVLKKAGKNVLGDLLPKIPYKKITPLLNKAKKYGRYTDLVDDAKSIELNLGSVGSKYNIKSLGDLYRYFFNHRKKGLWESHWPSDLIDELFVAGNNDRVLNNLIGDIEHSSMIDYHNNWNVDDFKTFPTLARGRRIGEIPENMRSMNFRENRYEPGVSSLGTYDGDNFEHFGGTTYEMFNPGKKNEIIGYVSNSQFGSDGEPIFLYAKKLE